MGQYIGEDMRYGAQIFGSLRYKTNPNKKIYKKEKEKYKRNWEKKTVILKTLNSWGRITETTLYFSFSFNLKFFFFFIDAPPDVQEVWIGGGGGGMIVILVLYSRIRLAEFAN